MRGSARRSAAAGRVLSVFGLKLEGFPRICGREFRRAPFTSLRRTFARPPEKFQAGELYAKAPARTSEVCHDPRVHSSLLSTAARVQMYSRLPRVQRSGLTKPWR